MVYFQSDCAQVYFHENTPCIIIEWIGYASSSQFHLAFEKTFDAYQQCKKGNKVLHLISDSRKMKIVSAEDIQWMNEEMNPKFYKKGLRYIAFIMPESIFATTAIEDYQKHTDQKQFTIRNFLDLNKAKRWLKAVSRKG